MMRSLCLLHHLSLLAQLQDITGDVQDRVVEGAGVPVVAAAVPGGGLAWKLVTPLIFLNSSGLILDENLLFFNHLNVIS